MSLKLKPGMVVRCIDDEKQADGNLKEGNLYTVTAVEVFDTGLSVSPQGRLASKWGEIKGKP